MTTKIKITGLDVALKSTRLKIGRAIAKGNFAGEMREQMIEEVRRNGLGDPLAPSTIETRRYLAQHNTTDKAYSASKANLTFTGALLNAMTVKFLTSRLSFIIDASTRKHKRYKKGSKQTISHREIFDALEKQGKNRSLSELFKRSRFLSNLTTRLKKTILDNYEN